MKRKWIEKTSNLAFSSDSWGLGMHMHCPACGHDYTHQTRIEVHCRQDDASDAPGQRVIVDGVKVHIDRDMTNNPSYRRDGIRIYFWCELCGSDRPFSVTIVQHKGRTFFEAQYYVEDKS
jgi:hypothetical protein